MRQPISIHGKKPVSGHRSEDPDLHEFDSRDGTRGERGEKSADPLTRDIGIYRVI